MKPFRVSVPDEEIAYLKERLASLGCEREGSGVQGMQRRWNLGWYPDILEDIAPWEDGTDLAYFKEFVDYWRTTYDWRKWEAKLNELQQFTTPINGIDLHFVHEASPRADATPLLLLHGWPGSYFEFYKLIPLLKEDGRFHIVAPSLPGYGFSSAPKRRGCGVSKMASIVDELIGALGYDKYIAQGGDWGSIICRALAKNHAPRCAAIHVNMCTVFPNLMSPWQLLQIANLVLAPWAPVMLTSDEMRSVMAMWRFRSKETGYQKIQGTKPQTLAYGLTDSPAGLAAWILEKFQTWTDCGGNPEGALTKNEMLTNISIYWFGGRIASSIRLYKESLANKAEMQPLFSGRCPVPTAAAIFPKEIIRPPRSWAEGLYNIKQWTVMPKGGHFAALEQPELLAADVKQYGELARSSGWV